MRSGESAHSSQPKFDRKAHSGVSDCHESRPHFIQIKTEGDVGDPMAPQKELLKEFSIQCRLAALDNKPLPTIQVGELEFSELPLFTPT
ncbi:unnamed protein product [Nippostrongylus brasiliensis]|uniref:Uncharacterized protein n=1 Tax=Nippostrongylus brasiliensis TaxID=27835 RepID=A0A0N4XHA3_NIPBR|nr:unnamed protein product [Nippostrongylus brasiliensis]